MPTLYSPDRRWYWNGQAWMPVPPAQRSLLWFTSAPDWAATVALMALVFLVPIVGRMAVYGWALEARDELRRGRGVVPPAGFSYLGRGRQPWLAGFIAGTVWFLVLVGAVALLVVATSMASDHGSGGGLPVVLGWILLAVAWLIGLFVHLVVWVPRMVVADERGLGPALDPARLWRTAARNSGAAWRGLGIYAAGNLLTIPLAFVVPILGPPFVLTAAMLGAASAMADMDVSRADR
jgi:hypothetical protein